MRVTSRQPEPLASKRRTGECSKIVTMNSGTQFITNGKQKFVYYQGLGIEQFFDLESDPKEMNNLIDEPAWQSRIAHYRDILIRELEGRPEGFVEDGKLTVKPGYSPSCLPGYERPGAPDENTPGNQLVDIDR